jgi:hypothetical protein
MAFQPAHFEARTCPKAAPMRYAVRRTTSSNRVCTLQLSISRLLPHDAGIKEGDGIRLDLDHKEKMGRILSVTGAQRFIRGKGRKGAACVLSFPYNGDIAKYFPQPTGDGRGAMTAALNVVETSKTEGVIFELPKN